MPIAHCVVSKNIEGKISAHEELIDIWCNETGIESSDVTVFITFCDEIKGKHYDVLSHLYLPTIWPIEKRTEIEIGLAKALSTYFNTSVKNIIVILSTVQSGEVVENGEVIEW